MTPSRTLHVCLRRPFRLFDLVGLKTKEDKVIVSRVVIVALMVFALAPVDKVMSQASEDVTTCCLPGGVCQAILLYDNSFPCNCA